MEQETCPLVVFGGKVGFLVLWNWMFSVFINEKEKTDKGPQSLWLFYYPHPTDKKSTRKGAEDQRNQEWSQAWAGRSPLCSPLSHRG